MEAKRVSCVYKCGVASAGGLLTVEVEENLEDLSDRELRISFVPKTICRCVSSAHHLLFMCLRTVLELATDRVVPFLATDLTTHHIFQNSCNRCSGLLADSCFENLDESGGG
jgi:hypothetical protein